MVECVIAKVEVKSRRIEFTVQHPDRPEIVSTFWLALTRPKTKAQFLDGFNVMFDACERRINQVADRATSTV